MEYIANNIYRIFQDFNEILMDITAMESTIYSKRLMEF